MIEFHGVSKKYDSVQALEDVTLDVNRGEVLTILGPNGSGKTTLLKLAAGLELPSEGEVLFDGVKVEPSNAASVRRRATLVFQKTVTFLSLIHI